MTTKEIGEKIRLMRESRGMTQKDLAKAINMSESAVAMYEQGNRRPKDHVAEAIADVFNVPKWAIFYNENEMVPADHFGRGDLGRIGHALSDVMRDMSEAGQKDVLQFARFILEKEGKGKAPHDD